MGILDILLNRSEHLRGHGSDMRVLGVVILYGINSLANTLSQSE